MKKEIKVSILVPIYNVERYLTQCLDSLVNQTLNEIEIICINDGSTDNSLKIIEEFAKNDSKIKIINKKNTGYGHSMNCGLAVARGEYIGIVESDDFADSDMFKILYQNAKKTSADIVKTNYVRYFSDGSNEFTEILKNKIYNKCFSYKDDWSIFLINPSIWSGIYQKEFLKQEKIFFNETPGASYQDTAFAFKVFAKARKIYFLQGYYLHYRVDNINSSVKSLDKVFCICDEFDEIKKYVLENNLPMDLLYIMQVVKYDKYIWNYLRIAPEFKDDFFKRMRLEFLDANKKKWLNVEYCDYLKMYQIQKIIYEPNKFFADFWEEKIRKTFLKNQKLYFNGFWAQVFSKKNIIIYGAGVIGKKIANVILSKNLDANIIFSVSDLKNNLTEINGIKIRRIDELIRIKDDSIVLVAVKISFQMEIINKLQYLKFKNVISIDLALLKNIQEELKECGWS